MSREDMAALYDRDFFEWTARNAELLRQGCTQEADLEHLAEEIEDLGNRDRRGVENRLVVLITHLLKWKLQPERRYAESGSSSWLRTIMEQRRRLRSIFRQSPSLERFASGALPDIYGSAVKEASAETGIPIAQFPGECPFRFDQVLEDEFLPE
jgi:Domain of unknown function DUF29